MGHKPLPKHGVEETREEYLFRLRREWLLKKLSKAYWDYRVSLDEDEPEGDVEMLQYVYSTCMGINKAIAQITNEAADRYYIGF